MASPKLTKEQAELQKVRLAEEVERRKALGNAGRQKSLSGHINDLVAKSLENIKHVVEGTAEIDKTRYDASKWVVTQKQAIDKHAHELKKLKWAAKKAEAEANAGGYGDKTPAKTKEQFEKDGLTSVTGGKFSMDLDNEFDEYVEEDDDE